MGLSYPTLHEVQIPVFLLSEDTDAARFPWRKVLVAVDGSEQAKEALLQAIQLSRQMEVEYQLLTVVPPPTAYAGMFGAWWENTALEDWGRATLLPYEQLLQERNLPFTSKVVIGDPAYEIRKTAEEEVADLLVLGHHGQGAIAGTIMGSVTCKLIHRAKLPLLIVKK